MGERARVRGLRGPCHRADVSAVTPARDPHPDSLTAFQMSLWLVENDVLRIEPIPRNIQERARPVRGKESA